MTRPLVVVALLLALVGCATPRVVTPPSTGAETVQAGTEGVIPAPTTVSIPAINASSTLVETGLNPDGTAEVPPLDQPWQASWFREGNAGVIPGRPGPAVIYGHVSGRVAGQPTPGVFARLADVRPGDLVVVERFDAEPLVWVVTRVETYRKTEFPTGLVYGDVPGAELRLVSCGGIFDPVSRSFDSNVVAYAVPG